MVYTTDRSKAVVPVLVLLFVVLVIYSTRRFVLCLNLRHFVLMFFSPFSIAITSLGEKRANLCACLDSSVSSSSWCPGTFLLPFV